MRGGGLAIAGQHSASLLKRTRYGRLGLGGSPTASHCPRPNWPAIAGWTLSKNRCSGAQQATKCEELHYRGGAQFFIVSVPACAGMSTPLKKRQTPAD